MRSPCIQPTILPTFTLRFVVDEPAELLTNLALPGLTSKGETSGQAAESLAVSRTRQRRPACIGFATGPPPAGCRVRRRLRSGAFTAAEPMALQLQLQSLAPGAASSRDQPTGALAAQQGSHSPSQASQSSVSQTCRPPAHRLRPAQARPKLRQREHRHQNQQRRLPRPPLLPPSHRHQPGASPLAHSRSNRWPVHRPPLPPPHPRPQPRPPWLHPPLPPVGRVCSGSMALTGASPMLGRWALQVNPS